MRNLPESRICEENREVLIAFLRKVQQGYHRRTISFECLMTIVQRMEKYLREHSLPVHMWQGVVLQFEYTVSYRKWGGTTSCVKIVRGAQHWYVHSVSRVDAEYRQYGYTAQSIHFPDALRDALCDRVVGEMWL